MTHCWVMAIWGFSHADRISDTQMILMLLCSALDRQQVFKNTVSNITERPVLFIWWPYQWLVYNFVISYDDQLRGSGLAGCQSLPFPIDLADHPYNSAMLMHVCCYFMKKLSYAVLNRYLLNKLQKIAREKHLDQWMPLSIPSMLHTLLSQ